MGTLDFFSASETQFRLELPDLKQSLAVLRFDGTDALSASFTYAVNVHSDSPLAAETLLGTAARLSIAGAAPRAGLIERMVYVGPLNDGHEYTLTLASPLHPLTRTSQSRTWVDQTLVAVLEDVLKPYGFTGEKLKKNLKGDYRVFAQVVQYNETDFDFLSRLSAQAGL